MPSLPIDDVLPALRTALVSSTCVVLQAPPGAGKTTRVPLALIAEPWTGGGKVILLEPRRLAARAAARRMASSLGESVGHTVGFRVRGESRTSARTKIEVVTEGVLTRMLVSDPSLDGVAAVILDEFHERSLQADLALALSVQSQEILRPDLRIIVMSATLDGLAIASMLGAAVIASEGRMYPVERRYIRRHDDVRLEAAVVSAVRHALSRDTGSILAFLPGAAEIGRCRAMLENAALPADVTVIPLFGALDSATQDAAIGAPPEGTRKVVLATSIAESSVTIDGVNVVVDSGLSRIPRFSPRTGMSRLETVRVSRASADQRSGRAGRTAPGVCYRLWDESEDAQLLAHSRPEMLDADLASFALDLAAAGVVDISELRWLDAPPAAALSQARALLHQLGALDSNNRITAHGRAMSAAGVHPRLAHMILTSVKCGAGATACVIAALLEERDVLRRDTMFGDADLRSRITLVNAPHGSAGLNVDRDVLRRVGEEARRLRDQFGVGRSARADEAQAGQVLAAAYPDRVAQRRAGTGQRYLLRNGTGAELADPGSLAGAAYLVIADADGKAGHSRIYLAAPVDLADVRELFAHDIVREDVLEWDAAAGTVNGVRRESLGALVLHEAAARDIDTEQAADILLDAIVRGAGVGLVWNETATSVRERVLFLRTRDASWPDVSDEALGASMREWLRPHLVGLRRRSEVERLPLADLLLGLLSFDQRRRLDLLAPTRWEAPTGSTVRIDYSDPLRPTVAIRLQELFGLKESPRVGGTVPLTFELLSPAHRPVQVTRDLAGFWQTSYFAVRKDLRGRYPKHYWPDDPLAAEPTRRAKPR